MTFKVPAISDVIAAIENDRRLDYLGTRSPALDLRIIVDHAAAVDPTWALAPATPDKIETIFQTARNALKGNERLRMGNRISRARTAIRAVGIPLNDGYGCGAVSSAWVAFIAKLPKGSAARNRHFASQCTSWGVAPDEVTQAVFDRYEPVYMANHVVKSRRQTWIAFVNAWSETALPILGTDAPQVGTPYKPTGNYRFDNDTWDPAFMQEIRGVAEGLFAKQQARRRA